ncbi:MAG: cytochrome b/b6 domain-containing protein [Wenzhouxiangellaceae bacterium]
MAEKPAERLVWDWPLRLWHWLFAIAVAGAWITGEWGGFDWREWHFWFGQSAVGLLLFRIVWGFAGTRNSRFISFWPRPRAIVRHLRMLTRRNAPESSGHSPVGALAVFALLAIVAAQAVSGLFISDDILFEGPWYVAVSSETADFASRIHHQLSWGVGALLGLHLAAILAYRLFKGQRLTRAMITGRKPSDRVSASDSISHSRGMLAVVLIALVAALTWWLLAVAPPEPPPDADFWY